ncbi:hypothetical protein [Thermoflexus hugenholtzii]
MRGQWIHRITWALIAFTLVILGAVVGQAARSEVATGLAVEVTSTPAADPNLEALLQEREQAYRQLIAEANARLQQAYQQIQELSAQQAGASGAPARPQAQISPARAIWIAMNVAPGSALMKEPELVLFQGILAYEVVLDQGTLYIDANTGRILYNGIPPVIQVVQAQPSIQAQSSPEKGGGKDKDRDRKEGEKEEHEKEHEEEHRDDD